MNKKSKIATLISMGVIILVAVLTYISVPENKETLLPSICAGILTSLIASLIFQVMSVFIFNSGKETEKLSQLIDVLDNKETLGIKKIRSRTDKTDTFWIDILRQSNKRLIASGRTLNRWLERSLEDDFIEAIKRVIAHSGEVILVIYKDLPGPQEVEEKNALKKVLIERIFPHCIKKAGKTYQLKKNLNFNIYEVNNLPYIFTANDFELVVSQYFQYASNDDNVMFQLYPGSKYGCAYENDFYRIIRNAEENTWLNEYIAMQNSNVPPKKAAQKVELTQAK